MCWPAWPPAFAPEGSIGSTRLLPKGAWLTAPAIERGKLAYDAEASVQPVESLADLAFASSAGIGDSTYDAPEYDLFSDHAGAGEDGQNEYDERLLIVSAGTVSRASLI